MKLTTSFLFLLCILFILCVFLYFIQKTVLREGLTSDNPSGVSEAKVFENDSKYGTNSSYITILPLQNFVFNSDAARGIAGSYPNISTLPISQYTIKSSYNSACSGNSGNITNEMLMYVLSRGCRFVDFEIANISGTPYVVSPNYNSTVTMDKTKIVPLDNILQTAVTYGLTNSPGSAPNYLDPLFIHLRIHPDPSYNDLYQNIAYSIDHNIGSNLYKTNAKLAPKLDSIGPNAPLVTTRDYFFYVASGLGPTNNNPTNEIYSSFISFANLLSNTIATDANLKKIVMDFNVAFTKQLENNNTPDKMTSFLNRPEVKNFLNISFVQSYIGTVSELLKTITNDPNNKMYIAAKNALSVINYINATGDVNNVTINPFKTTMSDVMGKVIILLDANYDPNWRYTSQCNPDEKNCLDLNNVVHLETGLGSITINSPSSIIKQPQTPIIIGKDGLSSSRSTLQFILPDNDMAILKQTNASSGNPDFASLVTNWSCNFITNTFYNTDSNLRAYEDFFNTQQSAILPLAYVKKYYTQQQIQNVKQ